jgi:hypothetical protein
MMKTSAETPSQKNRGEITAESVKQDVRDALSRFFTPVAALAGILTAFAARPKNPKPKAADADRDLDSR